MTPLSFNIVKRMTRYWLILLLAMLLLWSRSECLATLPALDKLEAIVHAEMTARDALVTIRRNAQDWKNLLLRGSDAQMRQMMQSRFDTQAATYELRLGELRKQMQALGENSQRLDIWTPRELSFLENTGGLFQRMASVPLRQLFGPIKKPKVQISKLCALLKKPLNFWPSKVASSFRPCVS